SGCFVGCFQPGRLPSSTLPADVQVRSTLSPGMPATADARSAMLRGGLPDLSGPPSLSVDPWKPSAPPRQWNWIVIHHTASARGSVESIHAAHLKKKDGNGNAWMGIGY